MAKTDPILLRMFARRNPDLPVDIMLTQGWMPLAEARRELHRAMTEHDRLCKPGNEIHDWRVLLFVLWRAEPEGIDIGGRLCLPNLSVELTVLDYPYSEKLLQYWQVMLEGDDRMLHRASGQFYFDTHLHARVPAPAVTDITVKEWYLTRVKSKQAAGVIPTAAEDYADAEGHFGKKRVTQSRLRQLRNEFAPPAWHIPGPKH